MSALRAALLLALAAGTAVAQTDPAGQACVGGSSAPLAAGAAESPFERADVRALGDVLTCYCGCPHLQVSKCFCGTADSIRADFARRLDAGETHDQIVAAYIAEHGAGIRAVPPREGFNWIIWLLPPLVIVLGVTALVVAGRRWSRPVPPAPAPVPAPGEADERLRERLRRAVEEGR